MIIRSSILTAFVYLLISTFPANAYNNTYAVQLKLQKLGYYNGKLDGVITPELKRAVAAYMTRDRAKEKEDNPFERLRVHPRGKPTKYKETVKLHLQEDLNDPRSMYGLTISQPTLGYVKKDNSCYWVVTARYNAKNLYGGYTGFSDNTYLFKGEEFVKAGKIRWSASSKCNAYSMPAPESEKTNAIQHSPNQKVDAYSHNGKAHNHPLPEEGVKHHNGNNSLGVAPSKANHGTKSEITNHSHNNREHSHPFPKEGIKHRHGNSSIGVAISKKP